MEGGGRRRRQWPCGEHQDGGTLTVRSPLKSCVAPLYHTGYLIYRETLGTGFLVVELAAPGLEQTG